MRTLFASVLAGVSMASSDHWAVIIAGSNTYGNYRHQSDAHHAYQIMKNNGIPEDQIILFSYDDIAQNWQNPIKGSIFNKPNGENVYFQDDISYSGSEVNADNFLAVLKGDSVTTGGKPVLKSDSNSKVFVYYADHGSVGFIGMPTGQRYLYADQLQAAFDYMEANKMYSELVFYLEACESGSMFPDLKASQNIYALTASNASLSSWASYCGSDAVVDGTYIGSCLGDLFSVNWMEDTEAHSISSETLEQQYETVLTKTDQSPVCKFGNFDFMSEPIGDFEGDLDTVTVESDAEPSHLEKWGKKLVHKYRKAKAVIRNIVGEEKKQRIHIDSRDVKLVQAFNKYIESGRLDHLDDVQKELAHRSKTDIFFAGLHPGFKMGEEISVEDWDCYRFLVNSYEGICEPFSDYSLKYARVLANTCNMGEKNVATTIQFMQNKC